MACTSQFKFSGLADGRRLSKFTLDGSSSELAKKIPHWLITNIPYCVLFNKCSDRGNSCEFLQMYIR